MFEKRVIMHKIPRFILINLFVLFLVLSINGGEGGYNLCFAEDVVSYSTPQKVETSRSRVDIRTGPNSTDRVLCRVPGEGTPLKVLARQGGWYKVKIGSCEGWVEKAALNPEALAQKGLIEKKTPVVAKAPVIKKKPAPAPVVAAVAKPAPVILAKGETIRTLSGEIATSRQRVVVRTGPTVNDRVLCRVTKKGTAVKLLGSKGDWYKVKIGSCEGWVKEAALNQEALAAKGLIAKKAPVVAKAPVVKAKPVPAPVVAVVAKPVPVVVVVAKPAPVVAAKPVPVVAAVVKPAPAAVAKPVPVVAAKPKPAAVAKPAPVILAKGETIRTLSGEVATNRQRVVIRTGPTVNDKVLCRVTSKGTAVKLLGSQGDWYKVKIGNCEGWLKKTDVQDGALAQPVVVAQKQLAAPPVPVVVAQKKPVVKKAPRVFSSTIVPPPAKVVTKKVKAKAKAKAAPLTLEDIMAQLNELKQKVDTLQRQTTEQKEVIGRQKMALDKIAEISPGVKEALLPPEPKFLVSDFAVSGAELFAAEDFEFILKKYRNQNLGMRDLNKIADEITGFYRSKGYITSLAFVPGQDVTDANVEFKVIEGVVGNIEVEEGEYYSKKAIDRKFLVKKGENLKYQDLQESIRRINRQPDRTVKAVLKPGAEKGTSDILLTLKEETDPKHFYLEYNNRGTDATTKNRYGVAFVHNNLSGHDDILSARARIADDSDVYSASLDYNVPVNRYDTRFGIYGAYGQADITGQFEVLEPEGKAHAWGVYLTHPLFDRDFTDPALNLSSRLTGGMDFVDIKNRILGQETSHDELTVAKAGISFDEKDRYGRTFFSNELRVGIEDFLDSMPAHTANVLRPDSGSQFVKYVGSVSRITRLPLSSLLVTSIRGQLTNGGVVSSEQLAFGGADSIRGFPENDYLADSGWISTFELRTPAFIFPRAVKLPYSDISLKDAMQFVYFVDFGQGKLRAARVGEDPSMYFTSAGVGLRFELYEHLQGTIDWGFPLGGEDPSDGSSNTVHVSIRYEM